MLAQEKSSQKTIAPLARNGVGDFLKGVAALCMIQVHLTELFALPQTVSGEIGKISMFLGGPLAAPLFMGIMGYFLAASRKSTQQLILRGLMLIIGGFLLNVGLNLHLFYRIFIGEHQLDLLPYLFGVDILFLAGLSTIIIALLKKILPLKAAFYFIGALLFASMTVYFPVVDSAGDNIFVYLFSYIGLKTPWSYFPIFPWFAYPLAGIAFYITSQKNNYSSKVTLKSILISSPFLLILFFLTWSYATNISSNLPVYYHHDLLFFIWTIIFLLSVILPVIFLYSKAKNNIAVRYLEWIGRNVTASYIFQWLVIGNIATALYKTQDETQLTVWFAGVLVLVSLLIFLWEKFKQYWSIDSIKDD